MSRQLTVVASLAAVLAVVIMHAPAARADCAQSERIGGECSGVTTTNNGEEVTVAVTTTTAGDEGVSGWSMSPSGGQTWVWEPPPIRLEAELGSSECEVMLAGLCRGQAPAKSQPEASEVPPTPPSHASQLKGFRPRSPIIRVEPDAWSLPTLPLNIYAEASRHRVSGELLGWPVEVRFTPVAYHWNYGDGFARTLGGSGRSLAGSGKKQFQPTETSHVFSRPGIYAVNLQVDYRVEFRFDEGPFDDIDGVVSARATPRSIDVLTVSPLLTGD